MKFRPCQYNKRSLVRYGHRPELHWQSRKVLAIKNYLQHLGGVLHYLACHAPEPIQKKWQKPWRRFIDQHRKF